MSTECFLKDSHVEFFIDDWQWARQKMLNILGTTWTDRGGVVNMLEDLGFDVTVTEGGILGGIVTIDFFEGKYNTILEDVFGALAEYARFPGDTPDGDFPYIEWYTEEGTQWRWVFTGHSVEEIYPRIVWDYTGILADPNPYIRG